MGQSEIMYNIPTPVIAVLLLIAMLIATWIAHRIGTRTDFLTGVKKAQAKAAMLGYSSGVNASQPATPVYLMLSLIVLLVFLIVDLDRPRRGIIEVDRSPMQVLLAGLQTNN